MAGGAAGTGLRGSRGTLAWVQAADSPPTRLVLGHSTWTLMHSMAVNYPQEPTPSQQEDMKTFFRLIGEFFPCDECARHFRGLLAEDPPDVRSNLYLSLWLCKAHNIVNRRVGNQEYPCTEEFITQRWGSCGCSDTNDDSGSGEEGGDAETPQSIFQHDSIDDDDDEDMAQANSAA